MIGPKKTVQSAPSAQKNKQTESKDIWDDDEVAEQAMDELDDGRETPLYAWSTIILIDLMW